MLKIKLLRGLVGDSTLRAEIDTSKIDEISAGTNQLRKWKWLNSFPLHFLNEEYRKLLPFLTHIKSGTGKSFSRVKIPEALTLELAYLLGAMRDGSLISVSGKHWIRLYDSSTSRWTEIVGPIFQRTFDVVPHVRYQKHIREKYLDLSSKPLFAMLLLLTDGALHRDVPKIIKKADIDTKCAYIAGFFDAEGHVPSTAVKHKRCRITFTQKDEHALHFIKRTLVERGIKSSKISNYSFAIYGEEMVRKFENDFRLLNPEKFHRLKLLLAEHSGLKKLPRGFDTSPGRRHRSLRPITH